ncbi:MAG: FAD/NAD(P)-binding protein [Pseudanabaena sp. ELA748]
MAQQTTQISPQSNLNKSNSPVIAPIIAIIGAGFSGTLVAVNLLKTSTQPLTIKLVERREQLAKGIAYGTDNIVHLLNVSAGNMTAFPNDTGHFLRWLYHNYSELADLLPLEITASTFIPRKVYGLYIQSILEEALATAPHHVKLERINDEAIAIEKLQTASNERARIFLKSQGAIAADKVVLALGNSPNALPQSVDKIRNAWSAEAMEDLDPNDNVLLIGTGLTMVDMVLSLHERKHKGKIYAVSRRGLSPQRHQPTKPYPVFLTVDDAPKTALGLWQRLRGEVQTAQAAGYDWRSVIDSLRPITQKLWQQLPLPEQQRFLRHAVPYWDVHRHRIAQQVAEVLDQLLASGQLAIAAGRIQSQEQNENGVTVTIQLRKNKSENQSSYTVVVKRVINCTGVAADYRKSTHPLVESLRSQKLIRPSPIGLGITSAANGALLNGTNKPSNILYTIGTPRKGDLWETIAVPELRVQAQALAETLLRSLPLRVRSIPTTPLLIGDILQQVNSTLIFRQFFDPETSSYNYLIADRQTREAVLVDPVLEQVERDLQAIDDLGLTLRYSLETHIHADHVTGAGKLRQLRGVQVLVPENAAVLKADLSLADGEILTIGSVTIKAIATNGHTNAHLSYLVNDTHLLTGDALFIRGCGRTDFQGGDAGMLYDAVTEKLFTLPDETLVYPAHDYKGRTVSTIDEEKRLNPRFSDRTREQFITIMSNLNLAFPKKMNEAVPANEYCGDFIPQDSVANLVINQDQREIELTVQKNTEIYNDYFAMYI